MPVRVIGKAAKQDQRVSLQISLTKELMISIAGTDGAVAYTIYKVLRDTPAFYTMASCFDQVKIDNIWARVVINVISPVQACVNGRTPLVAIAWDRNGVNPQQSLGYSDVCNYGSSKVVQLGSLIVGKPIDTGISAASAQEKLEFVSTASIMTDVESASAYRQWWPTMIISAKYPGDYGSDSYLSGSVIMNVRLTFRGVRFIPLGGLTTVAPAV